MPQLRWRKSSFSEGGADTCLEIAADSAGTLHLRESTAPTAVIATSGPALRTLLSSVKAGQFDGLAR
ncbi:DUF397 domain-containing protein [Streptomyces buecherae]|uniref:DUF397 domain-containing protein n=1 Tax=Streptomyces buecherae TaxID=2763006 RepID=A0A7H8NCH9_9ACTN|nr:DUF397 domain-containing protein [Streptomyces buecherae]QKW52163.1 DUF397 domain-containing protein [Streptomyces buecherae]